MGEPSSFGGLLRQFRVAAGLTQHALGERAGLSAHGIQNLERGVRRPYPDTLDRLVRALALEGDDRERFRAAGRPAPRSSPATRAATIVARPSHNLPAFLTPLIGRERETAEVRRLCAAHRLVTLTGLGGIGKTRLAIDVAGAMLGDYGEGVWLVELAALVDPALLAQTVAATLKVELTPTQPPLDTLVEALRSGRTLVVLDNCEHLLAAAARLVAALLSACPLLAILATSRERLGVDGERLYVVGPLALPEPDVAHSLLEALQAPAARLLLERAAAVQPDVAISGEEAPWLARVCRQLDGIPLAIELAAARLHVLTIEQLAERLDDRFRVLTGGSRSGLPRHQTLRATMDWSYDLLSSAERALFRCLAVFVGGWTLEAAEAVGQGPLAEGDEGTIAERDVLDILSSLVAKSLVDVEAGGAGGEGAGTGRRYRYLETIRQYAAEKLGAADEADAAGSRRLAWCVRAAERAEPHLLGPDQIPWFDRLEREHDNLRAALAWAARPAGTREDVEAGLRLAAALWRFWLMGLHRFDSRDRLAALLARAAQAVADEATESPGLDLARARALRGAGMLAVLQGEASGARTWLEESLALFRRHGDVAGAAYTLCSLGWQAMRRGDPAATRAYLDESAALGRGLPLGYLTYEPAFARGFAAQVRGDIEEARRLYGESIGSCRAHGDRWFSALPLQRLGELECGLGRSELARSHVEASLAVWREVGDRRRVARALTTLGQIEHALRRDELARGLFEESLRIARRTGSQEGAASCLLHLAGLAVDRGDHRAARAHLAQAREQFARYESAHDRARWLDVHGRLADVEGRHADAVRLAATAATLRRASHMPLMPADQAALDGWLAGIRVSLGEDAFARAWTDGEAGTFEQVADAQARAREVEAQAHHAWPVRVRDETPRRSGE